MGCASRTPWKWAGCDRVCWLRGLKSLTTVEYSLLRTTVLEHHLLPPPRQGSSSIYLHITERPSQEEITGTGYSLECKALPDLITAADSNTYFPLIKRPLAYENLKTFLPKSLQYTLYYILKVSYSNYPVVIMKTLYIEQVT